MILAIDTVGPVTGLALWDGGPVVEIAWQSNRRQTAELAPRLRLLLDLAAATLDAIDGIAVVTGPGSFNGIRVGLSTGQAIASARAIRLVGVTLFEAMIWPFAAFRDVAAVVPAGRDVAAVRARIDQSGNRDLTAARIFSVTEAIEALSGCHVLVTTADGFSIPDAATIRGAAAWPRPSVVAEIAQDLLSRGALEPVKPLYLRAPHITPAKQR
jgi:tRNA threonylcarbamoyladenosine biosynthesis protein TsaB